MVATTELPAIPLSIADNLFKGFLNGGMGSLCRSGFCLYHPLVAGILPRRMSDATLCQSVG